MFKNIILFVIFALSLACSPDNPKVDDSLEYYFDKFVADCEKYNAGCRLDNIELVFVDKLEAPEGLEQTIKPLAVCHKHYKNGVDWTRRIEVVKTRYGDPWPPVLLQVSIYHELGHCALNRPHDHFQSGTIMDAWVNDLEEEYVAENWDVLVKDLMTRNWSANTSNFLNLY